MAVRPATADDLDAVVDCWRALLSEHREYGSLIDPEENRTAGRHLLAETIADDRAFVAVDDGRVRGIATVRYDDGRLSLSKRRGIVETLYVRPSDRGCGLGTELLAAAERTLVERGCSVVAVEVFAANDRARSLYADRGYDPHRILYQREVETNTKPADEG